MAKSYYDPADLRKFGKITEWSEELGNKFFDYYGKVFEEGALSAREKSLIALAVSHVVKCPYCIDAYTKDGLQRGITKEEMIVICTIMRILVGTRFRTRETAKLDIVQTKITARHMTRVVAILIVTARAEHIPNTWSAMGLLLKIGSINTSFCDAMLPPTSAQARSI